MSSEESTCGRERVRARLTLDLYCYHVCRWESQTRPWCHSCRQGRPACPAAAASTCRCMASSTSAHTVSLQAPLQCPGKCCTRRLTATSHPNWLKRLMHAAYFLPTERPAVGWLLKSAWQRVWRIKWRSCHLKKLHVPAICVNLGAPSGKQFIQLRCYLFVSILQVGADAASCYLSFHY